MFSAYCNQNQSHIRDVIPDVASAAFPPETPKKKVIKSKNIIWKINLSRAQFRRIIIP